MKTDIFDFRNYRSYLKIELSNKIDKNPSYSLRSMAKNLGVASSTFSEVLNGKSNFSNKRARQVANRLNLEGLEIEYFCDLVHFSKEKDPEAKQVLANRLERLYPKIKKTKDLNIEIFKQISEWYHSAILELPYINKFNLNIENAAKFLGIPKRTSKVAIERLANLGLLKLNNKGNYSRDDIDLRLQSSVKSSAMRKYYQQMLDKISQALVNQGPNERLSGFLNIPINDESLPEIDRAIDAFFSDIKKISNKHKNKNTVYHLSCHFINLKNKEK